LATANGDWTICDDDEVRYLWRINLDVVRR